MLGFFENITEGQHKTRPDRVLIPVKHITLEQEDTVLIYATLTQYILLL